MKREIIRLNHNVLQPYVGESQCLASLLSPGNGGQPTKIRQAPDHHILPAILKQEKEGMG